MARLGYQHHRSDPRVTASPHVMSKEADTIMRAMSQDPFVTQRELADMCQVTAKQYQVAVNEVRLSDWAQQQILYNGTGTKYWTNTIMPLLESGTLQAAVDRQWMYPNRVGLYTGISCMFYCGFCGRNPVAQYGRDEAKTGFEFFRQIIDQDPRTDAMWQDRFRISGGLEPLTNPYLGDIITYGAQQGYRMQLYTNGNMMTARYLQQHPGMLDLEAVRFSLYGTTADKAYAVTRNQHSFDNIISNIVGYLNATSSVKVGINWIVLPGHADDVLQLIEVVRNINSKANRPIDFVTLREDFSQNIRTLGTGERQRLMEIFLLIDQFRESWDTHWDFGYALEPLRRGLDVGNLRMIDWQDMVPESFAQVSVAVDVRGNAYVYHESGFLDRPGADRYIIGNIRDSSVEEVTQAWVNQGRTVRPRPMDVGFLDAFDHVVSTLINQARSDAEFGIPWSKGPVRIRK